MLALSTMELERLIVIMRKMQQQASCGNWQELARLDGERRALLQYDSAVEPLVAGSQSSEHSQERPCMLSRNRDNVSSTLPEHHQRSLVEEICNLDKQIINEALAARAKLLAKNQGLNAQVKAKALYAQTNSFT